MTRRQFLLVTAMMGFIATTTVGCQTAGTAGQPTFSAPPAAPDSASAIILASSELTVRLLAPSDGAIFDTPDILVVGETSPGVVVSVNDAVAIADAQGDFALALHLEEGTNLLEFVASNESGDQVSVTLAVSYLPAS
jgi:hypothetical protein